MRVFKVFFKVLSQNAVSAVIYLAVFVTISVFMAFGGDSSATFEQTAMNLCIFDEDDSPESRALTELLAESNNVVELENDRDVLIDALYYGRADFVLTIHEGYAQHLADGNTAELFESQHMHDSYSTVYMEQFLDEYVGLVTACMAGGDSIEAAVAHAGTALSQKADVTMAVFEENESAVVGNNIAFYFRYLPYILISMMMNSLCPVLIAMNRKDIRYRTNCSGIRPNAYTMQLFAGSAVYIAGVWLLLMAVGLGVNGGMYQGAAWIAVANSLVFSLFSAVITILVSSFDVNPNVINIIAQVLSLGMSFLCGVFVDQSLLGEGVLSVARFLPAYWYIHVHQMLVGVEPFDTTDVVTALGIQAAFVAVVGILTLLIRRIRYTSSAARQTVSS